MARAHALSQAFLAMVRERRGDDLDVWRAGASSSGIAEVARFARGLQEDLAAVKAGITTSDEAQAFLLTRPFSWLTLMPTRHDAAASLAVTAQEDADDAGNDFSVLNASRHYLPPCENALLDETSAADPHLTLPHRGYLVMHSFFS